MNHNVIQHGDWHLALERSTDGDTITVPHEGGLTALRYRVANGGRLYRMADHKRATPYSAWPPITAPTIITTRNSANAHS